MHPQHGGATLVSLESAGDQPGAGEHALAAPATAYRRDYLHWLETQVESAQRQVARGQAELAEGIVRLAVNLATIRDNRYHHEAGHTSFERYVTTRFGIAPTTLYTYMTALDNLGKDAYQQLLCNVGVQRTYALGLIRRMDPGIFEEFLSLPPAEQQAVTSADLDTVAARLRAELQESRTVRTQLEQRIAQVERDLAAERGSKERLRDLEVTHRNDMTRVIDERDQAQRDLDRETQETSRLKQLLQQAQTANRPRNQPVTVSPALPEPPAAVPATIEVITTVIPCDIEALVVDLQSLRQKLHPLTTLDAASLSTEQRTRLMTALQSVATMIHVTLGVPLSEPIPQAGATERNDGHS